MLHEILALDHPDWTIPWAGIGAALMGTGSLLSGMAALKLARGKKEEKEEEHEAKAVEGSSVASE